MSFDLIVGTISFFSLYVLEGIFPFYQNLSSRWQHSLTNAFIAGINAVIIYFAAIFTLKYTCCPENNSWAILNQISIANKGIIFLLGFLLFDLWMYSWHRINHEVHFLWRFHRVHHIDLNMDSTTALRFHPFEILLSSIVNVFPILLIGLSYPHLIFYRIIFYPIVFFHHSNIAFPLKWDRIMRKVFVMPSMHRVHHSILYQETNSNYGSVFSFWDRLFKTYRERKDTLDIQFGIGRFHERIWQNVLGILKVPLQ